MTRHQHSVRRGTAERDSRARVDRAKADDRSSRSHPPHQYSEQRARRETMRWRRLRPDPAPVHNPKIAFVMSGGGSLGAMQAGQLLAMFEAGITPDLVIGVSAGAFNGAAIAHQPTTEMAEKLSAMWRGLRRNDVFLGSHHERAWHLLRRHPHLYRSDGLVELVTRFMPLDDLAQLATPFEAGTVNLDEARVEFHSTGNPCSILVASARYLVSSLPW